MPDDAGGTFRVLPFPTRRPFATGEHRAMQSTHLTLVPTAIGGRAAVPRPTETSRRASGARVSKEHFAMYSINQGAALPFIYAEAKRQDLLAEAEQARILGQDTLERCTRVFGLDHVVTLTSATGLTLALIDLGEAEQAATLGQDTLERCRRVFGPDHPMTLWLPQAASCGQLLLGGGAAADHPSWPQ